MLTLVQSLAACLCLAPISPAFDDTCVFSPRFAPDAKLWYHYRSVTEVFPPGTPDRDKARPAATYTFDATVRFTVASADDAGQSSLLLVFTRLKNQLTVDGATTTVELKEGDEPPPPPNEPDAAGKAGDPAAAANAVSRALMASVVRLDVHPDGSIAAVSGLEEATRIAGESAPYGNGLLAGFAAQFADRTLAQFFRLDAGEGGGEGKPPARKAGETWSISERAPISKAAELVATTNFTLASLTRIGEERAASLTGTLRVAVEPILGPDGKAIEPDPTSAQVSIVEQAGAVTAKWDVARSLLLERTRHLNLTTVAKLGSQQSPPQPLRSVTEIRLVED